MSMKYLGEQIDIHKGGIDHIRVHHTNEIAQSEGATGKKWVNYWLHNEFLVMNKGKMSKSSGSFIILEDVINKGFSALDYRFLLLGGHYRSQLTFSWEAMKTAKNGRKNLNNRVAKWLDGLSDAEIREYISLTENLNLKTAKNIIKNEKVCRYFDNFIAAMEDDLSTPKALSELQLLIKEKDIPQKEALTVIAAMDSILGIKLIEEALNTLKDKGSIEIDESEILKLIEERASAKIEKNYKLADEIRDKLKGMGIILEDQAGKTISKKL